MLYMLLIQKIHLEIEEMCNYNFKKIFLLCLRKIKKKKIFFFSFYFSPGETKVIPVFVTAPNGPGQYEMSVTLNINGAEYGQKTAKIFVSDSDLVRFF